MMHYTEGLNSSVNRASYLQAEGLGFEPRSGYRTFLNRDQFQKRKLQVLVKTWNEYVSFTLLYTLRQLCVLVKQYYTKFNVI